MTNTLYLLRAFIDQTYPPKSTFTEDDIPDLSGKVMIVTGGNTGIGKETVRALLEHNAKVYVACRNPEKAHAAIDDLKQITKKDDIHFIPLDLSSFESIRKFAEEFKSKETKLDVLFNNAGVMSPPIETLTAEGFDMQFGTNVVGPYLLTRLLLPLLLASSSTSTTTSNGEGPTNPVRSVRIVNTSSLGHLAVKGPEVPIYWKSLKPGDKNGENEKARRKWGNDQLYYQSKAGVILVSNELARRYGDQGVISMAVHPGTIQSELGRHWSTFQKKLTNVFIKLYSTKQGAITQLYGGTTPDAKDLNGKYLIPWARVGNAHPDVMDEKLGEKLWAWLEENAPLE